MMQRVRPDRMSETLACQKKKMRMRKTSIDRATDPSIVGLVSKCAGSTKRFHFGTTVNNNVPLQISFLTNAKWIGLIQPATRLQLKRSKKVSRALVLGLFFLKNVQQQQQQQQHEKPTLTLLMVLFFQTVLSRQFCTTSPFCFSPRYDEIFISLINTYYD